MDGSVGGTLRTENRDGGNHGCEEKNEGNSFQEHLLNRRLRPDFYFTTPGRIFWVGRPFQILSTQGVEPISTKLPGKLLGLGLVASGWSRRSLRFGMGGRGRFFMVRVMHRFPPHVVVHDDGLPVRSGDTSAGLDRFHAR